MQTKALLWGRISAAPQNPIQLVLSVSPWCLAHFQPCLLLAPVATTLKRLIIPEGDLKTVDVVFSDIPFAEAREHQGTFGFTYNRDGVDVSLLYSAQSRRFDSLGSFGLDSYSEEVSTLDLQINYDLNIISSEEDPFLETSVGGEDGVAQFTASGTYFGGRSLFVGISAIF